jgi:hypothetical protein
MSYVIADPEMMASAASDLAAIGSNVDAAHLVAAARTTSVIPAAADEVSAGIASVFSGHTQAYHAMAAHASAFHDQFVSTLKGGGAAYTATEAAGIGSLLSLLPPGIQNDLATVFQDAVVLLVGGGIVGIFIGYIAVYMLFSLIAAFLTHPLQAILGIPGLLAALGL